MPLTTDYTHGLVPGCTVQVEYTVTWVERAMPVQRPNVTNAMVTVRYLRTSGHHGDIPKARGGQVPRLEVDTKARAPRGATRNGGIPYAQHRSNT